MSEIDPPVLCEFQLTDGNGFVAKYEGAILYTEVENYCIRINIESHQKRSVTAEVAPSQRERKLSMKLDDQVWMNVDLAAQLRRVRSALRDAGVPEGLVAAIQKGDRHV
jgi:hypothetical protein